MSNGHAVFSPSGAEKWMACPGSIALESEEPDSSSDYSDEGTAAHWLAAECLKGCTPAKAYLGRKIHVVDGVVQDWDDATLDAARGYADVRSFVVTDEFAAHVQTYCDNVKRYFVGLSSEMLVEQRVHIGHITGEEGATGTSDAVIILEDELQVHDLKFGMGVQKYAKENPQGMFYLLGAMYDYEPIYGEFKRFRFVIHQPRLNHLDEWDCSREELLAFAEKAKSSAGVARTALEFKHNWVGKPDTSYLNPGSHCKECFCKARATCPALARFVEESVQADFDVLADDTAETVAQYIPDDLTKLGQKFAVLDIVIDWCKAVRAKCEATLFELKNSDEAQKALGIKLVQGKRGSRKWGDEEAAVAELKKMRLKVEEIFDLSVKSPTSIEKQLKDQPKRWKRVEPLITQAEGQPSVAPLKDKRPALVMTDPANDFNEVEGSELA